MSIREAYNQTEVMNSINIKKFGLAFGLTGAVSYVGCILLMATVGHAGAVSFFNSLFHGLDVSSIIRMNIPLWEAMIGIVQIFILSWLVGACIAVIYNVSLRNS